MESRKFSKNRLSMWRVMIMALTLLATVLPASAQEASVSADSTAYAEGIVAIGTPLSYEAEADTTRTVVEDPDNPYIVAERRVFNPDPTRAVWMSALFPGLGQIYNRRYWKLPIVVGGFMGLGYGTQWNNTQYEEYTQAYRDLLDSDPTSKSYMDFFPPTTAESDLDPTWLANVLKTRKDYYRRNRDLCIIGMAALYLLCIVDAYVDASLSHFDISPDVAMDVAPAIMPARSGGGSLTSKASFGLQWALTF